MMKQQPKRTTRRPGRLLALACTLAMILSLSVTANAAALEMSPVIRA